MIIGMDVQSAGNKGVMALVGSMNTWATSYVSISEEQPTEQIAMKIGEGISKMIQKFKAKNNVYPKRIIIYRDGLSDS